MFLYEWFENFISNLLKSNISGTPYELLKKLDAPLQNYKWIEKLENTPIILKKYKTTFIPNLEIQQKEKLRKCGIFFTPETLVYRLINENFSNTLTKNFIKILDPACGDGAWLSAYLDLFLQVTSKNLPHLYGFDTDSNCLLICLAKILYEYFQRGIYNFVWPNLSLCDFLITYKNYLDYFDFVLGNPPYKVNLQDSYKKFLEENFITTEGEKDLYTFFIEAAIKVLRNSGKLIFLTSHTYLVNHQCNKLRNFIFLNHKAPKIYILNYRFFKKAPAILPVILVLIKEKPCHNSNTTIHYFFSNSSCQFLKNAKIKSIQLAIPNNLRKALIPNRLEKILSKIDQISDFKIADIAKVGVGIQESNYNTGQKSKYVFSKAKDANFLPVVRGREIRPFIINWEGKYIYYGEHLAYKGNLELFQKPKIMYQNLRNESLPIRLVAALDYNSLIPKNSVSFITLVKPPLSLKYLVALLNSTLMNSWFAVNFFSFHITVTQVKQIPIVFPNDEQISYVEKLVDNIIKSLKTQKFDEYEILHNLLDKEILKIYNVKTNHEFTINDLKNLLDDLAKIC